MANVNRQYGFKPAKALTGQPWQALVRQYPATTTRNATGTTAGYAGDINIGDAVKLVSGFVLPAVTGDTILGVVVAVGPNSGTTFGANGYFDPNNLGKRYLGYNEAGVVGVVPAELALFDCVEATDLDLVQGGLADINMAAVTTVHGARLTGNSSTQLVVASNNDVQVVEQVTSPDNDNTLINARYLVKFQRTTNASN